MSTLEPRHELVVFNKKEIFIILLLFVLVALLSFTLGVRMGRSLTDTKLYQEPKATETSEVRPHEAPLAEKTEPTQAVVATETPKEGEATAEKASVTPAKPDPAKKAEDVADQQLNAELTKTGIKTDKPVSMKLPEKTRAEQAPAKSGAITAGRYTLQVGSHRTVSEAADQVMELKRRGLEAFYLEANLAGKGTWYRVDVGNFPNKEVAEQYAARFKNELPPYIVQKVTE